MPIPKQRIRMCEPRQPAANDWVELERELDRMPGQWRDDNPLILSDVNVVKYRETEKRFYFMAKLEKVRDCSDCSGGEPTRRNGLTAMLKIKDLPLFKKLSVIYYLAQRYRCLSCGKTFQAVSGEICNRHRMTKRLFKYIREQSLSTCRSFRDLADEVGVEEHVVRNIFIDYTEELQKNWVIRIAPWIAMDEAYTPKDKPRCVISSPLDGEVLEILCDNKEAVRPFFERLARHKDAHKIEVVSMDMWRGYRKVVRGTLPHAAIVVDRYHAQRLVNQAFKDALVVIRSSLKRKEQEEFMCPESLLLEGKFGSKKSEREKEESERMSPELKKRTLKKLFNKIPDVDAAYKLKEDFAAFLNLTDYDLAKERALEWLQRVREFAAYFYKKYERYCRRNLKRPFGHIHGTMTQWFEEILNYVKFRGRFGKRVTNAFAESINRKIKALNLLGYGYNFSVLRNKIVFGGILRRRVSSDPLGRRKKRRGMRVRGRRAPINPNSNVRRLNRVWEKTTGMVDLRSNPILNSDFARRMPIEEIKDPSEEKDPLELKTRFTSVNVRFKPGVLERLHDQKEDDAGAEQALGQPDLFSLLEPKLPVLSSASVADAMVVAVVTDEHVSKDDARSKSNGAQPSLF